MGSAVGVDGADGEVDDGGGWRERRRERRVKREVKGDKEGREGGW